MAGKIEILTNQQKEFLALVSAERTLCDTFYFTGGTPLSAFYLQHRMSEDLDYRQFLGLHTFQLIYPDKSVLKVDFNYYPFPRIEKGMKYLNISVDSFFDIAVNKVHTIFMKPRARDFIDIYFILKDRNYKFNDLMKQAKVKFDWHIDKRQFGTRLLDAASATDFPRMIKSVNHDEWKQFFVEEATKLKDEIFDAEK